jgi:serine protease Do
VVPHGTGRRFFTLIAVTALVFVWTGAAWSAAFGPETFIQVAKTKKPAVVNISTTQVIKQSVRPYGRRMPGRENDPWSEFFERFFENMPQEQTRNSIGSGFIYSEDGFIITNNHVVTRASDIKVKLADGKEYEAKVIGTDPKTDLALIKIDSDVSLPTISFGDSNNLQVGEWVMAIGNPFGLEHTVTVGVVSAKGRVIGSGPYDDFIQTDASINPGNSGGPLLNTNGDVVGINTAIFVAGQGIGFAIPSNLAKRIIEDLKTKGSVVRGWLGVVIQRLNPDLAKSFGLSEAGGALVADVVENSPAQKAGLQRGDVITKYDGKEIKAMDVLPRMVAATKPGTKVKVTLLRQGKEQTSEVTIGTLDEEKIARTSLVGEGFGMTVQELTPGLAEHFGLEAKEGVIVSGVEPGSPAHEGDIRRGDVILEVDRKPIKDIAGYRQALKDNAGKGTILFLVNRGGQNIYVVIKKG